MKDYDFGVNRVWYQSNGFAEGVVVTGRFFRPDGTYVDVSFNEHSYGIYSLMFKFDTYGRWILLILEDGTPACSSAKRVGF